MAVHEVVTSHTIDGDQLVSILKPVIPANGGIHLGLVNMDSRVRGNDERDSKPGVRQEDRFGQGFTAIVT